MRYDDAQERRSVVEFLKTCTNKQILAILSHARKGTSEIDDDGTYVFFPHEEPEED